MLSHRSIWDSIDALAERHHLSPSGLARLAGLDPTTFNPSKRLSKDGRPRWPSTESLAKILDATGEDFDAFLGAGGLSSGFHEAQDDFTFMEKSRPVRKQSIPLLDMAEAGDEFHFDDVGRPQGPEWDEIEFPGENDDDIYALEVTGKSMLPAYRPGDRLILSPNERVRAGDRVVIRTRDNMMLAKELVRQTARTIEVKPVFTEGKVQKIEMSEVAWISRIVWASQ